MQPTRAIPERPYSWGQYLKTLFLLIGFGWLAGSVALTAHQDYASMLAVPERRSLWLQVMFMVGIPSAALVTLVFLSVPLRVFMKRPISPKRALMAGFLSSFFVITSLMGVGFWLSRFNVSSSPILWKDVSFSVSFILLCTLAAWIIQRIIGPGAPPADTAKLDE